MMSSDWSQENFHFVTGKLAEPAVRTCVAKIAKELGFSYSIGVMPITVAALMTPKWLLRHLEVPEKTTRVVVPGYLAEGLETVQASVAYPVSSGPKDIRDLPSFFGKKVTISEDYGQYSIDILAEINFAPRLELAILLKQAQQLVADGANLIDLGCDPGSQWTKVADAVKCLKDAGIRCSIDTFDPWEALQATRAGAELVLSVNRSNRQAALDWGCEVVIVPDSTNEEDYLASIEESVDLLNQQKVNFRIDPILEPIGCGFAASLLRYHGVRKHFPEAPMMMGIGNLTELTDCDSAGINVLLLALCEEWAIHSILTTQVIPWAQSSVRECNLGRKLVAYALRHQIPPKRIDPGLVMLRDPKVLRYDEEAIANLVQSVRDNNYRIFIAEDQLHLVAANVHLTGTDPFEIMDRLMKQPESKNVDPSHAFYLGFELAKALTALTLGKHYDQDVALQWGMLTRNEQHRRLK
jgi:dihydropteroate synthase-like protein